MPEGIIEELELMKQRRASAVKRVKKLSFGWGIAGGVVALGIALAIFLGVPACQEAMHPAVAVIVSFVIGYAIFADIYCIICLSYIGEVFLHISEWSIHFPGLIFSWDLEGIAWLIFMKILFAILGFFVSALVLFLAVSVSAALAAVSFPFILIHNIRTNYVDAVVVSTGGGTHRRLGGRR